MGNVILEIQELANMGINNKDIAKQTKTALEFVEQVVQQLFEWDGPLHEEDA